MSPTETKKLFAQAALKACAELGPDLKKLSCFYENWRNYGSGPKRNETKIAA